MATNSTAGTANLSVVERALRTAAPHALLDAVRVALRELYAAWDVQLLMADYSLSFLQQVTALPHTAEAVPVHTSDPGRAFGSQQPFAAAVGDGRVLLYLPVTVRGDRLGILQVGLDGEAPASGVTEELAEIAEMLGHQIVVAERDTDLYLQARRKGRLTLAAEMQWQLLPARACRRQEYAIGAQLEPAYAIRGDNFDWSTTGDLLTLTVTNGMGEGIEASLLTNLAINALRNARRAGVSLADQAALADQAIYGQYQGAAHVAVLLLRFDLRTGEVEIVDAGSPRLLRSRGGTVERIDLEAQLPLGLADDTPYTVQHEQVLPGDRLIFVSDGVHSVASDAGEQYGERALVRAVQATRLLPAAEVPRAVLAELSAYRHAVADDDALVVCLDWFGRTRA